MGQITVRKLDDAVLQSLRRRAAAAGRSTEEEARRALAASVGIDRRAARERLDAVRATLSGRADRRAEDLVREMRDRRSRNLADGQEPAP